MRPKPDEVAFFASGAELRRWLEKNHRSKSELWIGYYKKASGRGGLTYREALDEALCFGWIDGQGCTLDAERYANRWTPRRAKSIWSAVNVKRVGELTRAGLMRPSGLAAFRARRPELGYLALSDLDPDDLPIDMNDAFGANPAARESWLRQPPSYRRQMMWWVLSAKREATRRFRLVALVEEHAAGRRIDPIHLPTLAPARRNGLRTGTPID